MPSLLGIALSRCLIAFRGSFLPSGSLRIGNEQLGFLLFGLYMMNMPKIFTKASVCL